MRELTSFEYVRGDVHGGGVVRDRSFEVGVHLEIVWNVPVPLFLFFLGLIHLLREGRKSFKRVVKIHFCSKFGWGGVRCVCVRLYIPSVCKKHNVVTLSDKVQIFSPD